MASTAFISITGEKQGNISQGCNTQNSMGNKFQDNHEDEITVLSYSHSVGYNNRGIHHPIQIVKRVDKSSPLLAQACINGEKLECELSFFRPNPKGGIELFYTVTLTGALIVNTSVNMPHTIDLNSSEMQEVVTIKYNEITWKHVTANTNGFDTWVDVISSL
ncbi:Hcp family type VI secretion system effector (plasmid) [Photobacterium sp. GJ3]|uniref:Hcp family type VI secretion system effector n=1 Tax=Photobacterium sp. GJ3 TaxID=2829502 RepID=UPI001B8C5D7A|nr:Hcp family type VI secretion system effector [Photobacterium sp. GJ3]QUJ69699.1 Hcp family type VI secretion system effector [Photobacterium sp. GJ3]